MHKKTTADHVKSSVGNGRDRSAMDRSVMDRSVMDRFPCDRSLQMPLSPETRLRRNRKQMRLDRYDYGTPGAYFVTICVNHGVCKFGTFVPSDSPDHGGIILNEYGKVVETQWKWLFERYSHISMDDYVIMPDHFHGIIHFAGSDVCAPGKWYNRERNDPTGNGHDRSLQTRPNERPMKPLPQIIGAFKTTSSKLIHSAGEISFRWQKSYYDRIIRNEKELQNIRQYIRNNPLKEHLHSESDSPFGDPHA